MSTGKVVALVAVCVMSMIWLDVALKSPADAASLRGVQGARRQPAYVGNRYMQMWGSPKTSRMMAAQRAKFRWGATRTGYTDYARQRYLQLTQQDRAQALDRARRAAQQQCLARGYFC